jgi:hypothetical protein
VLPWNAWGPWVQTPVPEKIFTEITRAVQSKKVQMVDFS